MRKTIFVAILALSFQLLTGISSTMAHSTETSNSAHEAPLRSFLIFGPPGAGKGTIGKLLCQAADMYHLSSGDVFRSLSPESSSGKLAKQYLDKGMLVPDDVTIQIVLEHIHGLVDTGDYRPDQQFILLDGIPRTVDQAIALDGKVEIEGVIVLEVADENELIQRLKLRAEKEGRSDDADEEILQRRLGIYREQTAAVLEHYPAEKIHRFNAGQPVAYVLRDVLNGVAEKVTFPSKVKA